MTEETVEHADDLGRRETLRKRCEVDDVREQDGRRGELVRDRPRLRFEPVGDRSGKDVDQQVVGSRLRVATLAREHGEQREDNRAADRDIEAEHRGGEPARDGGLHAAVQLSREPRAEEHDEIRDVPARRVADVAEDQRTERSEDPPEADPSGGEEPTQRDHRERRGEQDRDLADEQKPVEVPRAREDHDRSEQRQEVSEWHPSHRRAEGEIQPRPRQRDRQDQNRDQDEQRLARARLLVVARIRADAREPLGEVHAALAARDRSRATPASSCRRCSFVPKACSGCGGSTCSATRLSSRTYRTGMIVPSAAYSTATAHASSPSSRSTKAASGRIPTSRGPPPSTSTTRARYPFCTRSSGACASSPSSKGTTSSPSSGRRFRGMPKCFSAMCSTSTRAL